jgi:hypothetical protein
MHYSWKKTVFYNTLLEFERFITSLLKSRRYPAHRLLKDSLMLEYLKNKLPASDYLVE